ncbi:MAG: type II toxin-antitoxin system VapC family toxin [Chloroflexi bacterium]|nr:type II toxin-antitoxin system VapC family toxin [Chloroflexota bacterium]
MSTRPGSTEPGRRGTCRAMQYLVDTDWAIEFLRGSQRFVDRIGSLQPLGLAISVISLAELCEGIAGAPDHDRRERQLLRFAEQLDVLGVDYEVARIFGGERNRLRAEGRMIGDLDLLIGATALRHDLTLLTNNRSHFERISSLSIESIQA